VFQSPYAELTDIRGASRGSVGLLWQPLCTAGTQH